MLEQLLSILLTSHRLVGGGLTLLNKSPLLKGIFPGSRLGLHRMYVSNFSPRNDFQSISFSQPDSSTKSNTHYCRGDLGIVPIN